MKEIKLTQGKFAQVDDSDYDWLNKWNWCAVKSNDTYYAKRVYLGKNIYMHRLIMQTPDDQEVDHQDHNGLHCERHNMRNCTHQQNQMNHRSRGISKYLGVSIVSKGKQAGRIYAYIRYNYERIYLGNFKTEELAAMAYDKKAKELFGEFANLNFK